MKYSKCQKYLHIAAESVFIFQQNSAQLVWPLDENTMVMQLTEQNCSCCQRPLMYIKNLCTKMVQIIWKNKSIVFTLTVTYI